MAAESTSKAAKSAKWNHVVVKSRIRGEFEHLINATVGDGYEVIQFTVYTVATPPTPNLGPDGPPAKMSENEPDGAVFCALLRKRVVEQPAVAAAPAKGRRMISRGVSV